MRRIIFLFLLFFCVKSFAQDAHFSQFYNSPLTLNPALTGLFNGDFRFVGNYRNQWQSIPVPYSTFSASAEANNIVSHKQNGLHAGILVNNQRAGDSRFTTNQIAVSLAYAFKFGRDSSHTLQLGVQPMLTNRNFNTSRLRFDQQYDGTAYNPDESNGESFSTQSITYLDAALGLAYSYRSDARHGLQIGFSTFHINKPKQSFYDNGSIVLDRKINASLSLEMPISGAMNILPAIYYSQQGKYIESLIGARLKLLKSPLRSKITAFYGGVFYRMDGFRNRGDAAIFSVGADYGSFHTAISYDINTSRLTPASSYRGGIEFAVIYIFSRFRAVHSDKKICPVFM